MKKQTLHLSALKTDLNLSKKPIIIAVSGGSDSVALLHILSTLYPENQRIAVYIDHGLRPAETHAESQLVAEIADRCSATFIPSRVETAAKQQAEKLSLEEAARILRYQTLETIRKQYNGQCIGVGHTRDDQVEEILIRLIRGSGSAGLSGMAKHNGYIIRPLLDYSKETLRDYLQEHSLPFCEDSSNSDLRFLRNRVRHELLPTLETDYNQSIRTTLLQTAAVLREEDQLLDTLSSRLYQQHCTSSTDLLYLAVDDMAQEAIALQRRVFEKICWKMEIRPSFKQIESLRGLLHARPNTEHHLPSGLRAIREHQYILFHFPASGAGYRGAAAPYKGFPPLTIPGPGKYYIAELGHELTLQEVPFTEELLQDKTLLVLSSTAVTFPLTLRHHHPGERFQPLGSSGNRKISRFLTDNKIPATQKSDFPILLSGKSILAVVGLRISEAHRTQPKTLTCLTLRWRKKD